MNDAAELAARKQLLLARSTLYRLSLQLEAAQLRESMATPARGLALLKYLPIALVAIRLVARGRSAALMPSLIELASVVATWLLARRGPAGPSPPA
jgi:hypothetical protein